ncbi:anti-sigma B factor antagonist [Humidesulfovibrio mexicanus]|uniref:Anti-sigma factor antagonist n=1 Tax=Humidesulfovibrio mexicanus TaxID=147047 RepID=A0A239D4K5_9BACT|nr:STAS domain-containing protein [Humidesulfovibrio mexicanus]SNS26791.1 anti-sigma B factor antagonist [Humidesulfovibrio mexicanus]
MEFTDRTEQGVTVVLAKGQRLDAAAAPRLKAHMVDLIQAGGQRFVLNLEQVDFMDSSGLASLMSSMKTLGGRGEMAVCCLGEKVRKLFAITRLDRGVFRIFETEAEAVSTLAAGPRTG